MYKTPPYFFCDAGVVVWVAAVVVWVDAVVDVAGDFVVVDIGDVVVDLGAQASSRSKHTSIKARALYPTSGNDFNFIISPH
jgi:hypothetical protein